MTLAFPTDGLGGAAESSTPVRVRLALEPDLRDAVAGRARGLGVTPDHLMLAAYAVTLARWTGGRRLAVRTPDGVIAIVIDDDSTVDEHVRAIASSPMSDDRAVIGYGVAAHDDVSLVVTWADPTWPAELVCRAGVWTPSELSAFADDLLTATAQIAGGGGLLEDVRAVSAERRAWLAAVNDGRDGGGRTFDQTSLDVLFRRAAAATPDAVAVRDDHHTLTYAELGATVDEQARRLRAAGTRVGDTVLIGAHRSVAEIVAVLGTVAVGAAYVGVDLSQPAAHTDRIVARCRPTAILTDQAHATGVPNVDLWTAGWATTPGPAPRPPADPDLLAYVALTSGSTGEPKGVCIPHRAVVRLVQGADYVPLGAGARWLRLSPLAFDASTFEIWGPLLSGGTIEVFTPTLPAPSELGDFIVDRGVTATWMTSGLYGLMVEHAPDAFAGVGHVLTGGDVVPAEATARLLGRTPGLTVVCGYGPTENTTFSTVHPVSDASEIDGPLPIGRPVRGSGVHVLDERGRVLPPGAVGELYTSGWGLASGYLGDDAETDQRFGHLSKDVPERLYRTGDLVRFDSAGNLRFMGRNDDQVKIRGIRVELSAVSQALAQRAGVRDVYVFATGHGSTAKRVVAAVVPAAGETVDPARLRDDLADQLPVYMVPTLWAVVERLPLTSNGKPDRTALAAVAAPAG